MKIPNSRLLYTWRVTQNKQITTEKRYVMKDCQLKEKFCANRTYKITYLDPGEFS